jgi:glycerophosphoryl diester phosphodiesterase
MKIIGHRGAAGLAPENTLAAIKKALDLRVYAIEFDVRITADKQFILCHDDNLLLPTGEAIKINELTLAQIRKKPTLHGEPIPTLQEALELIGDKCVIYVEQKDSGCAELLLDVLHKYPKPEIRITTFLHDEVKILRQLDSSIILYAAERLHPFEIVGTAKAIGANGVTLNFWLLNPWTYWQARHSGIKLAVYTVNFRLYGWWIKLFYPSVLIYTNYPNKFINVFRRRKYKKNASQRP